MVEPNVCQIFFLCKNSIFGYRDEGSKKKKIEKGCMYIKDWFKPIPPDLAPKNPMLNFSPPPPSY